MKKHWTKFLPNIDGQLYKIGAAIEEHKSRIAGLQQRKERLHEYINSPGKIELREGPGLWTLDDHVNQLGLVENRIQCLKLEIDEMEDGAACAARLYWSPEQIAQAKESAAVCPIEVADAQVL